ncbi:MAG: hypothetical protein HKN41_04355 [Ilumatobacter sp.]|nr:hypothetical protein [Ilumatobacter sp.]
MSATAPATPMVAALLVVGAACGGDEAGPVATDTGTDVRTTSAASLVVADDREQFPDVLAVEPTFDGETWRFAVTISSPYDSPERYADGWRVVGPDGAVHGEHTLAHDHANEQPFTRTQTGVVIPPDVASVVIEGRDQVSGYGGATVTVDLTAAREEAGDG